jgi:hypothetical protein
MASRSNHPWRDSRLPSLLTSTALLLAASCVGSIGQPNPQNGEPGNNPEPGGGNTSPPTMKPPPPPVDTPGVAPVACTDFQTTPVFHRLNRTEYQNSVNALLGTTLPLRDDLPNDDLVDGFDNSADVGISGTLAQKYLTIAQKAVDAALADPALTMRLCPCDPATAGCVQRTLQEFLPRAFRRAVQPAEVADYVKYTTVCKSSPKAGLSCALQAALVSPKFLYRAEFLGPEATDVACGVADPLISAGRGDLSQTALAARLSYFLTSSAPDDQLAGLAAQGKLADPAVIAAQVERLLGADVSGRHARPFIESLPTQWLQVDVVKTAAPSAMFYPGWDEPLREAMQAESKLYFAELVRENRSALELLRSNFTFVNDRLARHYGLPAVTGAQLRRIDTTGTARGGILTQASFLTATSSTENTSIVHRAKWVLNNVLCQHIPDPPDDVNAGPLPDPGPGLTNRESLEMRTSVAPCNGCHATMNPIGYGLEVYDGIGASRTQQNGKAIDPSGTMPDGARFANANELMELLKKDERFPLCLTRKLLTYALGRGMEAGCDQEAIKALADAFKKDDYRLRNHIVRIAQSELFRTAQRRIDR